ncbi:hypothetical protein QN224_28930 [Sinorhizobium sp. 8-89]|uniref:hypothetical protein n=1 Tax=Sinorhizobium sp. 7-81 TaxID=3049087 RepID=UPI0024C295AD|nr:hypothetical protein [Sinorhizobium sp. 7-81]MDK1389418.1 hypothetical protein [Sinorhizobium sp. 7-81]
MGLAFRAWQIFTSIAAETRLMPFFVFLDLLECDVDFRCQQLVADYNDRARPPADFVVHRPVAVFLQCASAWRLCSARWLTLCTFGAAPGKATDTCRARRRSL